MSDAVVDCDLAARSVRVLLGRTEYLAAFDEADHALADHPADATLQWLAILALARAGATDTADERLQRSGLLDRADRLPVALAEDVLALEARIAKLRRMQFPKAPIAENIGPGARLTPAAIASRCSRRVSTVAGSSSQRK